MPNITLKRADVQTLLDFCEKHDKKNWFLAKDQGAYVGAAATVDGEVENVLFYFKGCDPTKNDDWYDEAHYKFGGDDFGEHFEVDILRQVLKDETMMSLIIAVGKTRISFKTKHGAPQKKAAPQKKPSAPKVEAPKTTIGAFAKDCIAKGWANEDVLKAIKINFPNAKTSNASLNWYRSQMRKAA